MIGKIFNSVISFFKKHKDIEQPVIEIITQKSEEASLPDTPPSPEVVVKEEPPKKKKNKKNQWEVTPPSAGKKEPANK